MPMQGTSTPVFVDANVHFSRTRRDWMALLCTSPDPPLFRVHWTEDVLAEVIGSLREKHPRWSGGRLTRIHDRFVETYAGYRVDDFTVDSSYQGRDPKDAHIHAAAIACRASYLVTDDTGFRWDDSSAPYELETSDDFFCIVDESAPQLVRDVVCQQLRYWIRRDGEADLPAKLRSAGCPEFAEIVRTHVQALDIASVMSGA